MFKSLLKLAALFLVLGCPNVALADSWTEIGNAKNLLGTAQVPGTVIRIDAHIHGVYISVVGPSSRTSEQPTLPANNALAPGAYYLVIPEFELEPASAGAWNFSDRFNGEFGAIGAGVEAPSTSQTSLKEPRDSTWLPEQATLLLLCTGLAGVAARVGRRHH